MLSNQHGYTGQDQGRQFGPGQPHFLEDGNVSIGTVIVPMMICLMVVNTVKAGILAVRIDMLVQTAHLQYQHTETGDKQYHTGGISHAAYYKRWFFCCHSKMASN